MKLAKVNFHVQGYLIMCFYKIKIRFKKHTTSEKRQHIILFVDKIKI